MPSALLARAVPTPPLRAPIVAIEGLSGAGKSRLLEELHDHTGWPVLEEAWRRLRPRPSLEFRSAEELLALELRLLRGEARRYRSALGYARRGAPVLCDTGFLGPVTYSAGLARLGLAPIGVARTLAEEASGLAHRGRWGLADLHLYLDTPTALARRRAARSATAHPAAWRERHLAVGRWERSLWLSVLPARLGGGVTVLDGRRPTRRLVGEVFAAIVDPPPAVRAASAVRALRAVLRDA